MGGFGTAIWHQNQHGTTNGKTAWPLQVPFAHDRSRISCLLELISDGRLVQRKSSRRAVAENAGAAHAGVLATSHESGTRSRAHGASTVPRVQDLAAVRQCINIRSVRGWMAGEAEITVAKICASAAVAGASSGPEEGRVLVKACRWGVIQLLTHHLRRA